MKVLIIEDEKPASGKLMRLLNEIDPAIEVIDILPSIEQSINRLIGNHGADLIFMDIQLEDGISFEIFEKCTIQTPIIFTTAYDNYTLKAFKVNSIDYLLKPISPDELREAIHKFNLLHKQQPDYSRLESLIKQFQPEKKERFFIKIGEHYKSIPISDIHCFYIQERCNFLQISSGKSYPVDYSLDKIEQIIDTRHFFRINRNYIINFYAIEDIIVYSTSRLKIILSNPNNAEEMIVSRDRVSDFKIWMDR
ncbi:MAG: LytTR family DNA-binding domain-containing protein [Tannerellaceae bacterium]|nr:LytTR family DNA-binding domain-containing protein [Tannerellaceae bacterium]